MLSLTGAFTFESFSNAVSNYRTTECVLTWIKKKTHDKKELKNLKREWI